MLTPQRHRGTRRTDAAAGRRRASPSSSSPTSSTRPSPSATGSRCCKLGRKVGEIAAGAPARRSDEEPTSSEIVATDVRQAIGDPETVPQRDPRTFAPSAPCRCSRSTISRLGGTADVAGSPVSASTVRPGEILGIAGIDGNGQKQLAEVLAGQRRAPRARSGSTGREIDGASRRRTPRRRAALPHRRPARRRHGRQPSRRHQLLAQGDRRRRRSGARHRASEQRREIERRTPNWCATSTSARRARRRRSASCPAATSRRCCWRAN